MTTSELKRTTGQPSPDCTRETQLLLARVPGGGSTCITMWTLLPLQGRNLIFRGQLKGLQRQSLGLALDRAGNVSGTIENQKQTETSAGEDLQPVPIQGVTAAKSPPTFWTTS